MDLGPPEAVQVLSVLFWLHATAAHQQMRVSVGDPIADACTASVMDRIPKDLCKPAEKPLEEIDTQVSEIEIFAAYRDSTTMKTCASFCVLWFHS